MKFPAVLKNKNFLLLWLAQGISTLGDSVTNLTLIILVNALTHSTVSIAILTMAIAIPQIVFGLFAGVYVDRLNRKYIMLASDFVRAFLVLGFIFAAITGNVYLIYGLAFIQAAVGTFFNPARAALVQVVVPEDQFMEANSISSTIMVIAQLFGATLAGLIVGLNGHYAPAFIVDALTFFASVVLVWFVRTAKARAMQPEEPQPFFHSMRDGLRIVAQNNVVLAIVVVVSMMMLALAPIQVLLVPFVVNTLHLATAWLGVIQSGDTVGNIVALFVITAIASRLRPNTIFIASVFGFGLVIAAIGAAFNIPSLVIILFFVGMTSVALGASTNTIMQRVVKNEAMGRVMSLAGLLQGVFSVVGLAAAGILGATLGVRNTFFLAGAFMVLTGIYAWFALRKVDKGGNG
jgi:MFS family permease